jgi:hypothetical protein
MVDSYFEQQALTLAVAKEMTRKKRGKTRKKNCILSFQFDLNDTVRNPYLVESFKKQFYFFKFENEPKRTVSSPVVDFVNSNRVALTVEA